MRFKGDMSKTEEMKAVFQAAVRDPSIFTDAKDPAFRLEDFYKTRYGYSIVISFHSLYPVAPRVRTYKKIRLNKAMEITSFTRYYQE